MIFPYGSRARDVEGYVRMSWHCLTWTLRKPSVPHRLVTYIWQNPTGVWHKLYMCDVCEPAYVMRVG